MSKLLPHTIEVYALKPEGIGKFRRRFQIDAPDSREAYLAAADELGDVKGLRERGEIFAVYQGDLDEKHRTWPTGFAGGYTMKEWERLRDAMGGVQGINLELQRRSKQTRISRTR